MNLKTDLSNKNSDDSSAASSEASYTGGLSESIGKKIRLLRQIHDISQTDLAEKIGVTFQQVQKYESGANKVSIEKLEKVAVAFGVEMSIFFNSTRFREEVFKLHNSVESPEVVMAMSDGTSRDINNNLTGSIVGISKALGFLGMGRPTEESGDISSEDVSVLFSQIKSGRVKSAVLNLLQALASDSRNR